MAEIIDFQEEARKRRGQSPPANKSVEERLKLTSEAEGFYHRILENKHPDVMRAIRLNGGRLEVGVRQPSSFRDSFEEFYLFRSRITGNLSYSTLDDYYCRQVGGINSRTVARNYVKHGTVFDRVTDKRESFITIEKLMSDPFVDHRIFHRVGYKEAFERRLQEVLRREK
jgi:hypothetical protein